MDQWEITSNGQTYFFTFEGINLAGKAKIKINEEECTYTPLRIDPYGTFYYIPFFEKELVLKIGQNNMLTDVNVDGTYILTQQPLEQTVKEAYTRELGFERQKKEPRHQNGLKTFFTFVIFTYVNMILYLIDAPLYFPFSAFVPMIAVEMGWTFYDQSNTIMILIIGLGIGLIFASVYLLFYFLSKSKDWALIVSLILVCIDTIVVLYFSIFDFVYYIIDIAFHGLIIYQMTRIIRERIRIKQRS